MKGLTVLDALVRAGSDQSVTDLANRLGLVRSNVHRTLQTLVHAGYAEKAGESGRYRPALRLWELGNLVVQRLDVTDIARPVLEELARKTGETALLAVLDGLEVIYLQRVESTRAVQTTMRVGARAPAHCTAPGKAMLAWLPAETLKALPLTFERHSDTTITRRAALLKELERTRLQGYSTNRSEWSQGVNGVAAPVCSQGHRMVAAINLSGPDTRIGEAELRKLGAQVREAAALVSQRLGDSIDS